MVKEYFFLTCNGERIFFSAIIRQFFQCRNFFRQVFPCRNFYPRNQSSGYFFLKSPISPPPPSQMVGSRMITRSRSSQKQVVRAREPASSFSHLGTSYCWEIIVVAETSYHFVIGRRLKLLQKKMTVLTFLVKNGLWSFRGVFWEYAKTLSLISSRSRATVQVSNLNSISSTEKINNNNNKEEISKVNQKQIIISG